MTINPIAIIRDRQEWKRYLAEQERILQEQRIRNETIDYLSRNGMLKFHVS